jgi:hypothetical protein
MQGAAILTTASFLWDVQIACKCFLSMNAQCVRVRFLLPVDDVVDCVLSSPVTLLLNLCDSSANSSTASRSFFEIIHFLPSPSPSLCGLPPNMSDIELNLGPIFSRSFCRAVCSLGQSIKTCLVVSFPPHSHLSSSLFFSLFPYVAS